MKKMWILLCIRNKIKDNDMAEGNGIAEIFDTREDGLRCVRFVSGEVGVVDEHGKVLFAKRNFKHATFAAHDFVKQDRLRIACKAV